ncbi:MAG: hypothetical protein LUI12_04805 [Clostridiales bacterium]|nr:hypothetical protein [Clostridiales bacterium]
MKKSFIITIDTEGDDLWRNKITRYGLKPITTENAQNIERFQILCEKYHFIPTYLVNYEMSNAEPFVELAKAALQSRTAEIGMHMHAWNCPPVIHLPYNPKGTHSYIGEYDTKLQWNKMKYLTNHLEDVFQIKMTSHRSGRWYLDEFGVKCLKKLGYIADCTVTPGVSWTNCIGNKQYGTDYSKDKYRGSYMLSAKNIHRQGNSGIYEIPPTILPRYSRRKFMLTKKMEWMRPDGTNLESLLWIKDRVMQNPKMDYLEFMLHSSELTAGTNPTFKTRQSINKLYHDLEILFEELEKDYTGISVSEYVKTKYCT